MLPPKPLPRHLHLNQNSWDSKVFLESQGHALCARYRYFGALLCRPRVGHISGDVTSVYWSDSSSGMECLLESRLSNFKVPNHHLSQSYRSASETRALIWATVVN